MTNHPQELEEFLDAFTDAIILVNSSGQLQFANRVFYQLFRCNDDVLYANIFDYILQKEHHAKKITLAIASFIDNQSPPIAMSTKATRCIDTTGRQFKVRASLANVLFKSEPCALINIQDFTPIEKMMSQLARESHTDSLTNLPNRRCLQSTLEKLSMANRGLSIYYLDLDGFKSLNDIFGHSVGDEVLIQVAQRIQSNVRSNDMCFRLGGDEFLVIVYIENTNDLHQVAQTLALKLYNTITTPMNIPNHTTPIKVGVSIGAAVAPTPCNDLSKLINEADHLMYKAKRAGKPFCLA